MTIVYDLLGFQNRDHGERGIARYVLHLALAIERRHPRFVDQYLVHPHLPLPAGIEPLLQTGKVIRSDRDRASRAPNAAGTFIAGSLIELEEPLDVVFPSFARGPSWQTAVVLYDLIPLRFREWYLTDPLMRTAYTTRARALTSFDHLLAISEASANDASELLGVASSKLTTIWAGADDRFRPPSADHRSVAAALSERALPALRPGYLLFPSGIERRKNIERLFEGYAGLDPELRAAHQLVMVCRVNATERVHLDELTGRLGIVNDVLFTDFVDDDTLVELYQGADLVVFPSLYEGYGLPVLEAMKCGAPTICSDSSSLREVQTDPAFRFDPTSVEAITEAIDRHLRSLDAAGRISPQVPDHSWDRAADLTVAALEAPVRTAVATSKPRLALVSPLPPQRSGIATYAARLLEHLTDFFDITVFIDPDDGEVDPLPSVRLHHIGDFEHVIAGGGAFDHVLYFMGNSSFHVEALELLKRHPGDVLFHDARLTGLYGEVHRLHPERLHGGTVGATIAALYPHRYREAVESMPMVPPETAARFGIVMTREIVGQAERSFVHSRYAAELIEHDSGVRPEVIFPIPAPPAIGSRRPPDGPPVIATFGIVAPVKCPDLLMETLSSVRTKIRDAELRFVGGLDDAYRDHLLKVASHYGVRDAVTFTGHLDDPTFEAEQQRATVAVQLRNFTNGESSAAITEVLAQGVPTVASNLAAMTELPDDVVVHFDHAEGATGLAETLIALLRDPQRQQSLSAAGIQYANEHGFAQAAARLAEVLTDR